MPSLVPSVLSCEECGQGFDNRKDVIAAIRWIFLLRFFHDSCYTDMRFHKPFRAGSFLLINRKGGIFAVLILFLLGLTWAFLPAFLYAIGPEAAVPFDWAWQQEWFLIPTTPLFFVVFAFPLAQYVRFRILLKRNFEKNTTSSQ